ncbi:uracil-DNA glycosylase [Candidatus Woesearchaeota archaeon]|jgi:uracil-DNA glycosylase|nr:uracil-DNA glycosylase [Candidatus Woesearchaeota archaeon]MBT5396941.1 uracil-DNA glycosylase [Candidatus Woesearchaeota archaeon]MBT5924664.1 uracil-DNA glycosylase [Candidatus Woesearchaeota archaeon]MBT6367134.1 uracil-DNA glycosylase [Candidatus Woesearchaeota archaeon]MBT7762292.1 uracil-DNA glycosylase [Candidatus Woesearchaeota archaeon]
MPFNTLKQEYSTCTQCEKLCESRTQVVFGSGNANADILFIGEAPGANEDKHGIPFCGMSGKILNELLESINLSRDDIFITNTILCRPPKNRNPAKDEVENCRVRLDKLIDVMKPKVIVTIGNFATERILQKKGITTLRGNVFTTTINNQEMSVVPVIHPASLLYSGRNPELLNTMKQDFNTILKHITI